MRLSLVVVSMLLVSVLTIVFAQTPNPQGEENLQLRQIPLPTSKFLIGAAPGVMGTLNGFTPTIAVSPDKRYAAFLNDGYGSQQEKGYQSIAILDLSTNKLTDFPDERLKENARQSYYIGLAFSSDGNHVFASMGSISDPTGEKAGDTGDGIAVYSFREGKVAPERFIKIVPQKVANSKVIASALRKTPSGMAIPYPAGLAVIPGTNGNSDKLLVANNYSDNIVLLDSADGRILKSIDVSEHKMIPSEFPYTCVVARDGVRAWCSLWNASKVVMLNLELGSVVRSIPLAVSGKAGGPSPHPTALLLSPSESELFVALSNEDQVMMLEIGAGPSRPLITSLAAGESGRNQANFPGSCPSALAQSNDGNKLFVADSCLDAVAVFDVAAIRRAPILVMPLFQPIGFIPTDWYPTALTTIGDDLLVATSKGQGTGPDNFPGQTDYEINHHSHAYIATLLYGSVARIKIPDIESQLPALTRRVEDNNRFVSDPGPIQFANRSNPIKHVIYILKENRSYDQVLGDLKVGNGDASLVMYGSDVTPNQHKLALQFGVLDDFYDSGEVSGNGHEWSTAAITSDYNEKNWQINYRGKERTYDFQGTVADEFPLENNESDVDAPGSGYIWDNLASHGLSYRDYGEFVATIWCKPEGVESPKEGTPSAFSEKCPHAEVVKGQALPDNVGQPHGSASPWPWPVPLMKFNKPTKAVLRDHFDPKFVDFNTDYPDQLRADEFLNEFEEFVRARNSGKGEQLPAFTLLYLPDDHTHGTTPGHPRPAASVADNDLAVGRVVEAVSHSPYWDDTAIFIVEDDAQNGADHVDAHRSIAFVISKYSPGSSEQPFVERRFYTTVSMIHTMETLLGLPPMNQNDGYAPVMSNLFSGNGNQAPFTADWSNRDNSLIYQMNSTKAPGAKESGSMDFSRPDAVDSAVLNAILWRDRKGATPQPSVMHGSSAQPLINRDAD
ncbi:MAG: phosphoesterase [Acidobacteriaceae bacterium]|nr:phosphoesterase [Acidobacteriaceae bacterium]